MSGAPYYPSAMAIQNTSIPLTLAPPTELEDADEDDLATDQKREFRAHTEEMLIIPHADQDGYCTGTYDVHRPGKDPYTVNPRELDESPSVMMCGDMQYRRPSGGCKHIRRIRTMVEQDLLPDEDEDATEYLESLADTYEQLVEERDALADRQAKLRRQIRVKADETDELERELAGVVERTADVENLIDALEEAPAVETA